MATFRDWVITGFGFGLGYGLITWLLGRILPPR